VRDVVSFISLLGGGSDVSACGLQVRQATEAVSAAAPLVQ
jgi:hypothetical protein